MKSFKEQYDEHIREMIVGLLRGNKKEAARMGISFEQLSPLVKKELSYDDYLKGNKLKTLKVNGLVYKRKTKFTDPNALAKPVEIKTPHF